MYRAFVMLEIIVKVLVLFAWITLLKLKKTFFV